MQGWDLQAHPVGAFGVKGTMFAPGLQGRGFARFGVEGEALGF